MKFCTAVLAGVVVLVLGAAGCSDSSSSTRYDTTGQWVGGLSGNTLTVTLNESSSKITGSGTARNGLAVLGLSVTGTNTDKAVSLTMRTEYGEDLKFTGEITSPTVMRGAAQGAGYGYATVILTKQ